MNDTVTRIEAIATKAKKMLGIEYRKANMDPLFEGGGFFCRRDTAACLTVAEALEQAFKAGFQRSDQPPPSEEKIDAAFLEWLQRS